MALVFSDRDWPLLTARSRVWGLGGSGVPGRSSGAAGYKGIGPCRGKTAVRVAMMARPAGSEGLQPDSNGSNTAGVPSVICPGAVRPVRRATYSRHRPGVCVPGVDRPARGVGEQVRPGPRHHLDQVIPAAGQQPAPAGQPTQDAHTIAPAGSPSPRSSPSRNQTSANRHELRWRPPCSAGPLPLSGLLGLPPREASAAVAVTARDQRRAQYSCLTSPAMAARGGCGTRQPRPLIRGSRHIVACN